MTELKQGAPSLSAAAQDSSVRFDAPIEKALQALLAQADERRGDRLPPLAVFDADGTLWSHDVGESFFRWLLAEHKLLGAAAEGDPWATYEALLAEDPAGAYASLAPKMAGLPERELRAWAEAHLRAHYQTRVFSAQQRLLKWLQAAGWELWICSASNRWCVQAGAKLLGLRPEHVIGIGVAVEGGLLTDRLLPPVTYRQGKVQAILQKIGRRPQLVSGNSMTDFEMLELAELARLVINPGPELTRLSEARGWWVQRFQKTTEAADERG